MNDAIAFVQTPKDIAKLMISLISENKKIQKNISILDTGCGKGIFLKGLQEA